MTARRRMAAVALGCLALAGCAQNSRPFTAKGGGTEAMSSDQFGQTDFNRTLTIAMRDNLASLTSLTGKLYKRNPREWRKAGKHSFDEAMSSAQRAVQTHTPPPDLAGLRDIQILAVALDPTYAGDRVAAFTYGIADTIVAAHNGKTRFYAFDLLDAEHVYNAARNVEAAAWLLVSRRGTDGQPLLLSNEISDKSANLSFEREFGAIIGRLDLVANLLGENSRRLGINYAQNLLFFTFLPVR